MIRPSDLPLRLPVCPPVETSNLARLGGWLRRQLSRSRVVPTGHVVELRAGRGVSPFPPASPPTNFSATQLHYAARVLRPQFGESRERAWSWLVQASSGDRRRAVDVLRFVERQLVADAERTLARAGLAERGWR